jgi:Uma2 family endonuclease
LEAAVASDVFPDAVITGELLERLRLPEIERYELVEGRIEPLTPMNIQHAEAVARIAALLRDRLPGWHVLAGDPGVYVRRQPDTVRGPDVVAISAARYQQTDPRRAFLTVMPELVVEIVSPSNETEDLARKVREYVAADAEVRVWVVNLDDRTVTFTKPGGPEKVGQPDSPLMLPTGAQILVRELFD